MDARTRGQCAPEPPFARQHAACSRVLVSHSRRRGLDFVRAAHPRGGSVCAPSGRPGDVAGPSAFSLLRRRRRCGRQRDRRRWAADPRFDGRGLRCSRGRAPAEDRVRAVRVGAVGQRERAVSGPLRRGSRDAAVVERGCRRRAPDHGRRRSIEHRSGARESGDRSGQPVRQAVEPRRPRRARDDSSGPAGAVHRGSRARRAADPGDRRHRSLELRGGDSESPTPWRSNAGTSSACRT